MSREKVLDYKAFQARQKELALHILTFCEEEGLKVWEVTLVLDLAKELVQDSPLKIN